MKERYSHMMRQMELSGRARRAILTEESRPRRRHPLRLALAAACVGVLLLGTVMAGELLHRVELGECVSGEEVSAYRVETQVHRWPIAQFSPRLREDMAEGNIRQVFDSREELEGYLGISLVRAPALEAAPLVAELEEDIRLWNWDLRLELGIDPGARYILTGTDLEGNAMAVNPEVLKITIHRVMENTQVFLDARIVTEYADPEKAAAGLPGERFSPEHFLDHQLLVDEEGKLLLDESGQPQVEVTEYVSAKKDFSAGSYAMPNGDTAAVITIETVERWMEGKEEGKDYFGGGFTEYVGYFVHGGILYTVYPYSIDEPTLPYPMNDYDMESVLRTVLNTFEQ